jgi:hypothetical protein
MVVYLQPDLDGQWVHEAEQSGGLPTRYLEQNRDAQVHEGLANQGNIFNNIYYNTFLSGKEVKFLKIRIGNSSLLGYRNLVNL